MPFTFILFFSKTTCNNNHGKFNRHFNLIMLKPATMKECMLSLP